MAFDPRSVPREQWSKALTYVISEGARGNPELLFGIVAEGEEKFVKVGLQTDQFGLKQTDYKDVYRRLCRVAKRWGYKIH